MRLRLLPEGVGWTAYVWTVYLLFFLAGPAFQRGSTWRDWAVAITVSLVFLVLYFRGYWLRGRALYPIIIAIACLGIAFLPTNYGAMTFFIYASAFAASLGTTAAAVRVIVLLQLVLLVEVWLIGMHPLTAVWGFLFMAVIGAVCIHDYRERQSNNRLRVAHDEIERLAKMAERERIARDLHDLLGHTLSLIVLKSELASKLAERDPGRARDEIRDVERISREALSEVRQAVGGYRAGWRQELESATNMLRTASIDVETTIELVAMPVAQEAIFSACLREAVTNVVRHSLASSCVIELRRRGDDLVLVVSDDGRGGGTDDGFGLIGMRERVSAAGGTISRDGSAGTTLSVTLPVGQVVAMEQRT